jgi:hypothetical protein
VAAAGDKLAIERLLIECPSRGQDSLAVGSAENQLAEQRKEFPGTPPRSCCCFHRRIYDVLLIKYGNNVRAVFYLVYYVIDRLCICSKHAQKMLPVI